MISQQLSILYPIHPQCEHRGRRPMSLRPRPPPHEPSRPRPRVAAIADYSDTVVGVVVEIRRTLAKVVCKLGTLSAPNI